MFRSPVLRQSAACPRQPVSQALVSASLGVSRVLGGKNERFAMAADYKAIAAKATNPAVADVAMLGVALALNRLGLSSEVIEVTTPLTDNNNSQLARAAQSLKTRSVYGKLEDARSAALVSGAANEDQVSALNTQVAAELSELAKRGNDYGSKLAYAEYLLSSQTPQYGVVDAFSEAFTSINTASGEVTKTSTVSQAAILTQLARYQSAIKSAAANPTLNSKTVQELLAADNAGIPQVQEALAAYKATLGDSALTNQDVLVLATAQASIETSHHHFDFFDNVGDYNLWANGFCTPFANQLNSFANPEHGFATGKSAFNARVNEIGKPVSGNFYGDVKALEAALENKSGDVLDNIIAQCGVAPTNALATGDESYYALTSTLDKYVANHPSLGHGGAANTESHLLTLQASAIEQLAFRATVGKAVALERNNKFNESLHQLDVVINENRYLHMWKALLARGRTNRALGHLDAAEKDFATLHKLKAQDGYDIPQLDENRYKSVF